MTIASDARTELGWSVPDGMTLDAHGYLWVAVTGTGEVRRYSPDGELVAVVEVPVACPTSAAFGGTDLGDLYITTMTPHTGADAGSTRPVWEPREHEGRLFRCRPGVTGRPAALFSG